MRAVALCLVALLGLGDAAAVAGEPSDDHLVDTCRDVMRDTPEHRRRHLRRALFRFELARRTDMLASDRERLRRDLSDTCHNVEHNNTVLLSRETD